MSASCLLGPLAMKKTPHKLTLSAETVRNLGAAQLRGVAGGIGGIIIHDTQQISCGGPCGPSDLNICVIKH